MPENIMKDKLEIIRKKIISTDSLKEKLAYLKFKNQKIVFTNGCFDIIHRGHVEYLAKASDYGDILIVGLNSDSSVRQIKGNNRPVTDENARASILASMSFVGFVVLFDEATPYELIKMIQPDVLVKGSDYKPENIAGGDIVLKKGGVIRTIDLTEGYSTSSIIDKINNR